MKRLLVTLVFILLVNASYAQVVITMEKDGELYKIPCHINGLRMKFIFDTGASVVSMSKSTADFLLENGYIETNDIVGKGRSITADGSVVNNTVLNIRDIEISGKHLYNVQAVVIDSQNAPLLLGQSAIQKLGRITISGDNLILTEESQVESYSEIIARAESYYFDNENEAAVLLYKKLDVLDQLDAELFSHWINCYSSLGEWSQIIELYNRDWLSKYNTSDDGYVKSEVFRDVSDAYRIGRNNPGAAIVYGKKAIDSIRKMTPTENDLKYWQIVASRAYESTARAYHDMNDNDNASRHFQIAGICRLMDHDIIKEDTEIMDRNIINGRYNNPKAGELFMLAAFEHWKNLPLFKYLMKRAIRLGCQQAKDEVIRLGIYSEVIDSM